MWHNVKILADFMSNFLISCWPKLLLASSRWEGRKNVFNLALLRNEIVDRKQAEVETTSHYDKENCKRRRVEDVVALLRASRLDFHCKKLVGSISLNSLIKSKASVHVRSTFLAIPNAQLKTFFLTRSVVNFGHHGISNSWQKPEIDASFQLMSHLLVTIDQPTGEKMISKTCRFELVSHEFPTELVRPTWKLAVSLKNLHKQHSNRPVFVIFFPHCSRLD